MTRQIDKNKAQALMKQKVKKQVNKQDDLPSETPSVTPVDPGKRKFVVGSLGAAPILFTLSSRPVMAANCTISGFYSADLSGRHDCDGYGRSPGYWKNHPEAWPPELMPCGNYKKQQYNKKLLNEDPSPCTLFHDLTLGFKRGVGEPWAADATMFEVMYDDYSPYASYHAIAALCNAYAFPGYSLTPQYVRDLYNEYVETGIPSREELRSFFDSTWSNHFDSW